MKRHGGNENELVVGCGGLGGRCPARHRYYVGISALREPMMDYYEELQNEIEILKLRVEQLKDDKRNLQETLRLIANSNPNDVRGYDAAWVEVVALARAVLSPNQ
jgi:hypothetical protein